MFMTISIVFFRFCMIAMNSKPNKVAKQKYRFGDDGEASHELPLLPNARNWTVEYPHLILLDIHNLAFVKGQEPYKNNNNDQLRLIYLVLLLGFVSFFMLLTVRDLVTLLFGIAILF